MSGTSKFDSARELVTMRVAGQSCGIPVNSVRDVLGGQRISAIPLAPPAIAGSLNLRGRIVTVLDVRILLDLGRTETPERAMNVVIEHRGELYALLVDQVGDVLSIDGGKIEPVPQTVMPTWKLVSAGIVKLQEDLVLILIPETLLQMAGLTAVQELAA